MIGQYDTVSVTVFREPDLSSSGQLGRDGKLSIPLIGAIKMEGLSTLRAEQMIEARFRDGYLRRPQVTVRILKKQVQTVTVLGQVQQPGVFTLPVNRVLTVVEVIGMAGGVTEVADEKKVMLRSAATGRTTILNLKEMMRGRAQDVVLSKGDVVTVPEGWF
ncbi:MAG: polysaccharide biosynthesis/export family protein [Verrucomicrobiota bacterium]